MTMKKRSVSSKNVAHFGLNWLLGVFASAELKLKLKQEFVPLVMDSALVVTLLHNTAFPKIADFNFFIIFILFLYFKLQCELYKFLVNKG